MAEIPLEETKANLNKLYRLSLIQPGRTPRFRLHSLLRDPLREKMTTDLAYSRMAEYYAKMLQEVDALCRDEHEYESVRCGLVLFDREWSNIVTGQAWAAANIHQNEASAGLCTAYSPGVTDALLARQHPCTYTRWHQAALGVARESRDRSLQGNTWQLWLCPITSWASTHRPLRISRRGWRFSRSQERGQNTR